MIKKITLFLVIIFSISVFGQRRKQSWTENVRFSVDPHTKVMTALGNNFLSDSFGYFYGFGIGLDTNLYKNFGLGVEYTYFLATIKDRDRFGYLGAPSMNNFDWYIFHKDKIAEDFFVEELVGYSTYRLKSPFLDNSGTFLEGNSGVHFGGKAIYVLDVEGVQEVVFGARVNLYNSKIGNADPEIARYYSKAVLLNFSLAYRFNF